MQFLRVSKIPLSVAMNRRRKETRWPKKQQKQTMVPCSQKCMVGINAKLITDTVVARRAAQRVQANVLKWITTHQSP